MSFAVIKLYDDDITIETVLPTVEKCNQFIRSLTHITLGNNKKVIQSHISNENEIDMDGYYINLDKITDRYQILERKTVINSGWIVNSITQKCSSIGWLYIREMPISEKPNPTHIFDKVIIEPPTQLCQLQRPFPKAGKFCSPELMAELVEKIKNRHTINNTINNTTTKVKSD